MSTPEGASGRGALCSQLFAALPLIENGDRRGHQPGKVTPVLAEPLAARVKADAACIPPAAKAVMPFRCHEVADRRSLRAKGEKSQRNDAQAIGGRPRSTDSIVKIALR